MLRRVASVVVVGLAVSVFTVGVASAENVVASRRACSLAAYGHVTMLGPSAVAIELYLGFNAAQDLSKNYASSFPKSPRYEIFKKMAPAAVTATLGRMVVFCTEHLPGFDEAAAAAAMEKQWTTGPIEF